MWFFRAVALDLDGTLAVGDRVSDEILATIDETRSDRAVLLVTGRVHSDLDKVFPGLTVHSIARVPVPWTPFWTSTEGRTLTRLSVVSAGLRVPTMSPRSRTQPTANRTTQCCGRRIPTQPSSASTARTLS